MTPYLLDPMLECLQTVYALGNGQAMGFYPNDDLIAKRQRVIDERSENESGTNGTHVFLKSISGPALNLMDSY